MHRNKFQTSQITLENEGLIQDLAPTQKNWIFFFKAKSRISY